MKDLIFKKTIKKLLQGEFLCSVTAPKEAEFLVEEENFSEAKFFLEKLGYNLEKIPENEVFYLTYKNPDPDTEKELKKQIEHLHLEHRVMTEFFYLLNCLPFFSEGIQQGDRLCFHQCVGKIEDDRLLSEHLRKISLILPQHAAKSNEGTLFERVCNWLVKTGYLLPQSEGKKTYLFTGKIHYYYLLNDYLLEKEKETFKEIPKNTEQSLPLFS